MQTVSLALIVHENHSVHVSRTDACSSWFLHYLYIETGIELGEEHRKLSLLVSFLSMDKTVFS